MSRSIASRKVQPGADQVRSQAQSGAERILASADRVFQSAPALGIGTAELTNVVSLVLQRAFPTRGEGIREIAELANTNERAAKNWYHGKNCPDALHLLRLMATVPELQAEVRRLTGMEAGLDPDFGAAMVAAATMFAKLQGRR